MDLTCFNGVKFNGENHTYTLNGELLPSVTQILSPLSERVYGAIPKETLNTAADRGTLVHNAIEIYLALGMQGVRKELEGFFEAFLRWWGPISEKAEVLGSEVRMYHKLFHYAGTCDLLVGVDDKVWLVDFKTTATIKDLLCSLQLEGYAQALSSHGIKVDRRLILQLKKDGTFKEHEYLPSREDCEMFNAFRIVNKALNKAGK